jgi:hypothetical protein
MTDIFNIILLVRLDVLTEATMKNSVFWDVTPCDSYKNLRFGETYQLHHQRGKNQRLRTNLAATRNSVLTGDTRRHSLEDCIRQYPSCYLFCNST